MGAASDDLLDAVPGHGLHVGRGHDLVEILVAQPAGGIAAALLLHAQHRELHARGPQDLHERGRDLLVAFVERARAADVETILGVRVHPLAVDRHFHGRGPLAALVKADAPGVGVLFHVLQGQLALGRQVAFHQGEVATQVDNLLDVLVGHRTLVLAGAAGGAGPEGVGGDLVRALADERQPFLAFGLEALVDHGVLDAEVELLGRERLAGDVGRAHEVATATLLAGDAVEELFPGELGDGVDAPLFLLFQVGDVLHPALGLERGEEDVERGRHDVLVLGERQEVEEPEEDKVVEPP